MAERETRPLSNLHSVSIRQDSMFPKRATVILDGKPVEGMAGFTVSQSATDIPRVSLTYLCNEVEYLGQEVVVDGAKGQKAKAER